MAEFRETSFDFLDCDNYAVFCTSERKWVNKILKLKESNPNDVNITTYPENNDGYIVAQVPKNWFKLSPPHTREMTDEQREAAAKRLADAREKRKL